LAVALREWSNDEANDDTHESPATTVAGLSVPLWEATAMGGVLFRPRVIRALSDDGATSYDVVVRERAQLCREAAHQATPLLRLLALSIHPDEAVRACLYGNPSFRLFAPVHARHELLQPGVSRVTWQAIAASEYVGAAAHRAVFALRNTECEHPDNPPRSLAILIPLVNTRSCPRDIHSRIVLEREFERFGSEGDDWRRPTHLHHAHLRRAYEAVYDIAKKRLDLAG
jgi:hypothetical protein